MDFLTQKQKKELQKDKKFAQLQNQEEFTQYNKFLNFVQRHNAVSLAGRLTNLEEEDGQGFEVEVYSKDKLHEADADLKLGYDEKTDDLSAAQRYLKMKALAGNVNLDYIKSTSIDDALEWAISSAVVDGASTEYKALISDAMRFQEARKQFDELKAKYESSNIADRYEKYALSCELNALYQNVYRYNMALRTTAASYIKKNTSWFKRDRGKARLIIAEKLLNLTTSQKERDSLSTKASVVTAKSLELLEGIKKPTLDNNEFFHKEYAKRGVLQKFDKEYGLYMDRIQGASLFDPTLSDEAEKQRQRREVLDCMEKSLGGNMGAMFPVLDRHINTLMAYTIPEKLFDKEWILQHPEEVAKLYHYSTVAGDILYKGSTVMPKITAAYFDKLEKTNKEASDLISKKLTALTNMGPIFNKHYGALYGISIIPAMLNIRLMRYDRSEVVDEYLMKEGLGIDYVEFHNWNDVISDGAVNEEGIRHVTNSYDLKIKINP